MAEWVDIPGAIRVADPAGLLADCDNAVAASVQTYLNTWAFTWSGPCPGCQHIPPLVPAKRRKSVILDVGGLHHATHTPRRCRRRDCPERGFYLWCSFQVHGRKVLRWRSAVKALPSVILLTQRFGSLDVGTSNSPSGWSFRWPLSGARRKCIGSRAFDCLSTASS